jgi:hypothetical protein
MMRARDRDQRRSAGNSNALAARDCMESPMA